MKAAKYIGAFFAIAAIILTIVFFGPVVLMIVTLLAVMHDAAE